MIPRGNKLFFFFFSGTGFIGLLVDPNNTDTHFPSTDDLSFFICEVFTKNWRKSQTNWSKVKLNFINVAKPLV
jgi:hypothetical protein